MNALSHMLILIGLLRVSGPANPPSRSQAQPDALPAQLAETDSRKVAYVEHSGPYWSLGPVIDKVARDARAMGVRGSLVVRYLDDPVAASPRGLRAEVGFEVAGTDLPKSPYKIAQWPIALVARKSVSGSDGLSTRHFTSLKAWAQTQGLAPAGDLIAVVQLAEDGESTAIESAEIQLPVCVPDPPATNAPLQKSRETQSLQSDEAAPPHESRTVTKVIPFPVTDAQNEIPEAQNQNAKGIVLSAPPQQPIESRLDGPTAKSLVLPAPTAEVLPIRRWIEEKKFAEVVGAIYPESLDPASQQWADQIAARILALTSGIQKLSPGEEGWLGEFANLLADRRTAGRAVSHKGTPRVIGPKTSTGSKENMRKAVIQDLDRLMANVSNRAMNPEQVRENLIQLLEQAHPLVLP